MCVIHKGLAVLSSFQSVEDRIPLRNHTQIHLQ